MRMGTSISPAVLLRLLTWFSPAFPTGAFGFSHGLETAIRDGRAGDVERLSGWIADLLEFGSGWTDAVLFKLAWAAQSGSDPADLAELAELGAALAPSLERRRETLQLGQAFLKAVGPWLAASRIGEGEGSRSCDFPAPPGAGASQAAEGAQLAPYPVAAGWACAAAGVPLSPALAAFLHAFAANLVSVATRAVPLGQTAGVAVMAALEPLVAKTAARAVSAEPDDLGGCALLSDIAAMRHETLPGRLFLS